MHTWLDTSKANGAVFSPCRRYRYTLWRVFDHCPLFDSTADPAELVAFIGLNPSTADETKSDPTVTRCVNYAKAWGYHGMVMLNLFGWRDTDRNAMKRVPKPVGAENDAAIKEVATRAGLVLCCWGADGVHKGRAADVTAMLRSTGVALHCLKKTTNGQPWHPLYLPKTLTPKRW